MAEAQRPSGDTTKIVWVVTFYFVISIALVFLNKFIMSGDNELRYPLFITWWQLIIAVFCMWVLGTFSTTFSFLSIMPKFEIKSDVVKAVLPLSLLFVGMVTFNNLCLLYVEVSLYQVTRSLTICFTIVFTKTILNTDTSKLAISASGVVMLGFILGSVSEVNFSALGVIFGVLSSMFVSLYGIYVKKVMAVVDNDNWKLLLYNNFISIFLMLPLMVVTGEAFTLWDEKQIYELSTWWWLSVAGIFGFLINIAVFLQIKYTSPLTNNISGTLKACVQTLLALMIWNNPVSFLNGLGISLVIGGSAWYSQIRYNEMKNTPKAPIKSETPVNIVVEKKEEDRTT